MKPSWSVELLGAIGEVPKTAGHAQIRMPVLAIICTFRKQAGTGAPRPILVTRVDQDFLHKLEESVEYCGRFAHPWIPAQG